MVFSITFLQILAWGIYLTAPILMMLCIMIVILGLVAGHVEKWSRFDTLYWAFITALTVGYGDIRPLHKLSRVLSAVIAILGIMFAGIIVAITVEATTIAFNKHIPTETIDRISSEVRERYKRQ
ncbi:MAG: two pore domain potassium channel family protein [Sinobacterium sp.]|nr:two pore domain potassium channel family protein [Sinobacterium sp.]